MIKILVITHGRFGEEIVRTAESIVGRQEGVTVLVLNHDESLATMCKKTEQHLAPPEPDGILILTDMLGGTPCNACLPYCTADTVEIVSGLNLYMLLSAFMNRGHLKVQDLAKKVLGDGRKSVANAKEIFLQKLK